MSVAVYYYPNQTNFRLCSTKTTLNILITEQKRKECIVAANDLTQALVDHLNVG